MRTFLPFASLLAVAIPTLAPAATFTGSTSATFGTPTPSTGVAFTGVGANVFSSGVGLSGALNNLYTINGKAFSTPDDTPFAVAGLIYRNGQTSLDVNSVPVSFLLAFSDPSGIGDQAFNFTFDFTFTPNLNTPVEHPDNDDFLDVENIQASTSFVFGGNTYTLRLLGFGPSADDLTSSFRLPENQITRSTLWAEIAAPIIIEPPSIVPLPAAAWAGLTLLGALACNRPLRRRWSSRREAAHK